MAIPARGNSWMQTWIEPWWVSHRDLEYINEPFNDADALKEWQALGYTQTRFSGDMYDMRNPEPHWISPFRHYFPWKHFSWSVYRMGPGCTLPNHGDLYTRFREIYSVDDIESIYRAVIFLEDWQSGHYFEIEQHPITNWQAGDTIVWRGSTHHLAANVGKTNRYTLQITGIPSEDPLVQ